MSDNNTQDNMKHDNNTKKLTAFALASIVLVVPMIAMGKGTIFGADICSGPDCDFDDIIKLFNVVIDFLIYKIVVPLITLGFMYAGIRLVISQDKEKEKSAAKAMLGDIATGLAYITGSFLLIKFILYQFLNKEEGFALFLLQ